MDNKLEVLNHWVHKGMPEGARYISYDVGEQDVHNLKELDFEKLIEPNTCSYIDPPDVWVECDATHMLIKLQYETKIEARKKIESLDDAWNQWGDLENLLVLDVFKYDYRYLAGSENYNRKKK